MYIYLHIKVEGHICLHRNQGQHIKGADKTAERSQEPPSGNLRPAAVALRTTP